MSRQILLTGSIQEILAYPMPRVGQERAAEVPLAVELSSFLPIIYGENEAAAQAPARIQKPAAALQASLGELAFTQCDPLLEEIFLDLR